MLLTIADCAVATVDIGNGHGVFLISSLFCEVTVAVSLPLTVHRYRTLMTVS